MRSFLTRAVVEDAHALRLLVAEFLREEGFEVIEAEDGREATDLLDDDRSLDALLTNLEMPGTLDGIDVATHARGRYPTIPVLIISGNLEQQSGELDQLSPSPLTFNKPARLREIANVMRSLAA